MATELNAVERMKQAEVSGTGIAVVVFGAGILNMIPLARKLRADWSLVHFIFAPSALALEHLKLGLSRAPLIGSNWSVVESGRDSLPDRIAEAASMNRRRAQLRTTLDRANIQIGTFKPADSHDYRRLVISDHYLKNLLAQARDAIVSLDSTARVLYWSGGAERLFGLRAEKTVGHPVHRLSFWSDTLADCLDQVRARNEVATAELSVSTLAGVAQVETIISGVRDDAGALIGFSLFMRDVTERKLALEAEREARLKVESVVADMEYQRRLFDSMLSSAADQAYVLDLEGRFLYANRALTEQLELELDWVLGRKTTDLGFPADTAGQIKGHIQEVVATRQTVRAEVPFTAASGRRWVFEYILVPVVDNHGRIEAVAGTSRDITEHKKASDRVWKEANYDSLTLLSNRRLFRDRLELEIKHAQRKGASLALFFVDLDRFKEVNDLYGHGAGDDLLRQAAARIHSCVRESDTVARLGGDEFTVILTELDNDAHVESTAQKILDELARPFRIHENVCYVSGSIGVTLYPKDAVEPGDLIRNADQAMYIAKNNGRSQFSFFTRSFQDAALNRLRLMTDLRYALSENQLRVYFQPIVSLADSTIVKAEALVRWEHPTQGLLLSNEFITLAEESGQIKRLGNWVFTQAAHWSKRWGQQLGRTFQISINKSPVQFEGRGHRMNWVAYLKEKGLAGDSISVEITEGVILNATTTTSDKLLELQAAGMALAIDDFGTGYSSMAYLKKFDVDYLKIDQSFVQDMASNASSRTIAESIIVMGHKLGLKVIAEGVETEDQRKWLRSVGCDYAQGFLFSKALQPDEFESRLNDQQSGIVY
ncbi:putative bifunctional diguanylate cyclase/phosphodiesterase [Marinobacter fonticola]|uniref:putative bifunctional diguanylate cyclase/phosphodiesterase n=1 Tax=Marinobacter fonticola TaxID=2603215 RepID=UPI00143DBDB5|nr:bifunctional diguanylate cyclase/phosphodiesterase [Marinobacter fonticola]